MSLDQLAQIGEFVGGIVVVISLVYVAMQIRQNTRSLRTENYARVVDRMSTLQARVAADAELNRIFMVGAEDPGRLTRAERVRFAWAMYELFGAGEFMFHQARARALPAPVWTRWEAAICWWLSHPGMRAWWLAKPARLSPDFEAFGDEIVRTRRVDEAALRRWHGFVAGEGLVQAATGTTEVSAAATSTP